MTLVAADHQHWKRRHFDFIDQKLEQNDELLNIDAYMFAFSLLCDAYNYNVDAYVSNV